MKPLDVAGVPSPYREILVRELGKLRQRDNVLAVGVTGSIAAGDTWPGSDLDIEVVLKGDKPKQIVTTEQEISVDYGYFGESVIKEIPSDTRPVYDPTGILTKELASRDVEEMVRRDVAESLEQGRDMHRRGAEALLRDAYSGLVFAQGVAWRLCYAFILVAGERWTIRRAISRLEAACKKTGHVRFFENLGQLYGFPRSIERAGELMFELQQGYRDIWPYFKRKEHGPPYMLLQPDSEAWFRNRIKPLYDYDKRNIPWIVYSEFPSVTYYIFRLAGHEKTPANVFEEAAKFEGRAALWSERHRKVLQLFPAEDVPSLLETVNRLLAEVEEMANSNLQ